MVSLSVLLILAQPRSISSYSVKVDHQPAMLVIWFTLDDGTLRVNLPSRIVSGQRFFSTVGDERGLYQSSNFSLEFADQPAPGQGVGFSWVAPAVHAKTHVPLVLKTWAGQEVARADVVVQPSADDLPSPPAGFPKIIQSGRPAILSGSFDGYGKATVTLGGRASAVMAQDLAATVVMVPADAIGLTQYEIKTADKETSGEVRCVSANGKPAKSSLRPGERTRYQVVAAGLKGFDREIGLLLVNNTPGWAKASFLRPTARTNLTDGAGEILFVEPGSIRPDGAFHAVADLEQTYAVPSDIHPEIIMPRNVVEEVALLLQIPRHVSSKLDPQEHAELLRQRYGERALPLLGELINRDISLPLVSESVNRGIPGKAVDAMLALDFDRATPLILAAARDRKIQPNLDPFNQKAAKNPAYPYRELLHDAGLRELTPRPIAYAAEAVGLTGSPSDLAALTGALADAGHPLIHDEIEAAMARLGSEPQISAIQRRLDLAITKMDGRNLDEFRRGAHQAAFTSNPKFLPALCRHLGDPSFDYGDVSDSPGTWAADAILKLKHAPPSEWQQVSKFCNEVHGSDPH
jgi:hypothetical protein